MKRIIVVALCWSLIWQGCSGMIVTTKKKPEIQKYIGREEVISEIPEGTYPYLKLGALPISPPDKNTIKKLEKELAAGETIWVNKYRILIETQAANGKWYRGWVGPGRVFIAKKTKTQVLDDLDEFVLIRLAYCWNPVRGVTVRVYPPRSETVTKKTDYTPALWALFIGGVVGYFLHEHICPECEKREKPCSSEGAPAPR